MFNFLRIYFYYTIKLKKVIKKGLNPIESMTRVAGGPELIQYVVVLIFFLKVVTLKFLPVIQITCGSIKSINLSWVSSHAV